MNCMVVQMDGQAENNTTYLLTICWMWWKTIHLNINIWNPETTNRIMCILFWNTTESESRMTYPLKQWFPILWFRQCTNICNRLKLGLETVYNELFLKCLSKRQIWLWKTVTLNDLGTCGGETENKHNGYGSTNVPFNNTERVRLRWHLRLWLIGHHKQNLPRGSATGHTYTSKEHVSDSDWSEFFFPQGILVSSLCFLWVHVKELSHHNPGFVLLVSVTKWFFAILNVFLCWLH